MAGVRPPAVTLWLVRHAETAWNRERRYQGQTDVPLDEGGLRQAEALARRFARERDRLVFGRVWSSDLRRAAATAEAVAAVVGLPVAETALLREMDFGAWEGRTRDEVAAAFPENYSCYRADPARVAPLGGESFLEVLERARTFLRLALSRDARRQLVVGHGASLKALVIVALGLLPEERSRIFLGNAGVTVLALGPRGRGEGRLVVLDDRRHLRGAAGERELCRL